jgi:HupE/UreJ protein
MRPSCVIVIVLIAAFVAIAATASAHPTALTSVTIVVGESFADVAIATDADALKQKLDALQRPLTDCIDLRADGVRVPLTFLQVTPLHLRAELPAGTKHVTWSWALVYGSYPVVFQRDGDARDATQWLQGTETSAPYAIAGAAANGSHMSRIARDVALGFTHILPNGLDHILFVLGLFFLTRRVRSVLAQVTAFTLAHSITLGLALYGVVSLPAAVVEPLIALSIAYVAIENLVTTDLKPWRLALVFGFGLLHGMGFAEALARLDLPRSEFLTTLVGFNAGVEAGQLTIIAAASIVVSIWALPPERYRRLVVRPASVLIAAAGIVWTIQRVR